VNIVVIIISQNFIANFIYNPTHQFNAFTSKAYIRTCHNLQKFVIHFTLTNSKTKQKKRVTCELTDQTHLLIEVEVLGTFPICFLLSWILL